MLTGRVIISVCRNLPNAVIRFAGIEGELSMLGLFKKKMAPEGPVDLVIEIEIDRPPEMLFAMLDWSSPENRQVAMGHTVVDAGEDQYMLHLKFAPDDPIAMQVVENVPNEYYKFVAALPEAFGCLDISEESYTFASNGAGGTKLKLETRAFFRDGMTMDQFQEEVGRVAIATQNALTKLRMHAEHGLAAALAVEDSILV